MHSQFSCSLAILNLAILWLALGQCAQSQDTPRNSSDFSSNTRRETKVPTGAILVKGAWSSASDSVTSVPEDGNVDNNVFRNQYFGMTYTLPRDWIERYKGPPPSDSGRYVLAQVETADTYRGSAPGSILITAQDIFFTQLPATDPQGLINYIKDNLQAYYKVELPPAQARIAGRPFTFFEYWSPVAELHWYVLTTQIRCHLVQLVLSSRDTKLLKNVLLEMNKGLSLEATATGENEMGTVPVCIKDYASDDNVIARVDPVFTEHTFNPVPVR